MPDFTTKPTQPLGPAEVALIQLVGEVTTIRGQITALNSTQDRFAAALEEHSLKSAKAQAELLNEINRVKFDNATACQLHTGDQRAAVEKLKLERRMADHEIRSQLAAYEKERTEVIGRLNKVCDRLEKGDRKIARGEMAFNILKWAGIVIGGLLLAATVTKLFLTGETIHIGRTARPAELTGIIGCGVAKIWSAWLVVTGLILAVFDFKTKHLGG